MSRGPFRFVHFSTGIREAGLPAGDVAEAVEDLIRQPEPVEPEADQDLVVAFGSELIECGHGVLPSWAGAETKYLLLADIPEPAVLRFPTILRVHKPDRRIHISRDRGVVKRLAISLLRDQPWEGIVDAYVLDQALVVVLGDFTIREFPQDRLPVVCELPAADFRNFDIHTSGSYLFWPAADVHMGPSQMLQAVDPMYLTEIEIERYAMEKVSVALRQMREERGLTQGEIAGLSERHVRRLENEEFRLTVDAAESYAETFGASLDEFLDDLSGRVSALRDESEEVAVV